MAAIILLFLPGSWYVLLNFRNVLRNIFLFFIGKEAGFLTIRKGNPLRRVSMGYKFFKNVCVPNFCVRH
jgi:hypothetical protein